MEVFEVDAKCQACRGTGVYVGMAERDGASVVCHRCKGEGHYVHRLEWEEFTGRAKRKGITRVFEVNPGICIGENQNLRLSDFGGISYDAWLRGESFPRGSENRGFTCPAWWYQSANYDLKPDWDQCLGAGGFSSCAHFPNRVACWARWDEENRQQPMNKGEHR